MEPIKVAIIGYGLSAKIFHIPFILALPQDFTLYGILQRNPTSDNNAAHDHSHVKTWTSLDTMLADPSISLVIITSIPSSHFTLASAAIRAGKHVVCEKPFVPTSAEARRLSDLAAEHNVVLSVYQNRRWDADFLTLKSLISEGSLGRIAELESHFDRHRPDPPAQGSSWKLQDAPGVGAIFDLGSHLLDQFVALFGMPERVTGIVGNQRVYEVEETGEEAGGDSFTVLLHYDRLGMLGTAKAGVVSAERRQLRYWARGTKGSFKKFFLDVQEDQLKAGKRPGDVGFGVEDVEANGELNLIEDRSGELVTRRAAPSMPLATYVAFYESLARAIRGQGENPVSARENAQVVELIELAKLSSKEERTVRIN